MIMSKWKVLSISLITVFALAMVFPMVSIAKDYKLAISQGWLDNDSGQNLKRGYLKGIKDFFGEKDDGRIVIDEVVGQLIALAPLLFFANLAGTHLLVLLGAGFLLFRLFDIWKPGPVRWAERRFEGGVVCSGLQPRHLFGQLPPVLLGHRPGRILGQQPDGRQGGA